MQKKFLQTLAVVCITFGGTNPALCAALSGTLTCLNLCNPNLGLDDSATYLDSVCHGIHGGVYSQNMKDSSELKDQITRLRQGQSCEKTCDSLLRNDPATACARALN